MSYIGTGVRNRALTSADIAQGAVTLDDISFTDQPTNLNILGTIDKHTMRLADNVTVTGDVTLSDDLVLAKLSDDGNAITLTNDSSTRTITGSGSINASTLAQTPNASLTGMTGEISSSVLSKATFEGTLNSNTTFSGDAGKITAKAWVTFDGTTNTSGVCTILDSFNVTNVTDNGTGDYTINFTNNMSNANYAVVGSGTGDRIFAKTAHVSGQEPTVSTVRISLRNSGGTHEDDKFVNAVVFGN